jgi:extracellular factor (EF) 3-hydroxypalmitic acid methyl ester biosynthesis protein
MAELSLRPSENGVHTKSGREAALDVAWETIRSGRVEEGMSELLLFLQARRLQSSPPEWEAFVRQGLSHPLRQLLHEDPFTRRAFTKPRGYAGDAELLDFIYGREEGWPAPAGTSDLGRQIFEFTTRSPACEAVRARRGFVAEAIDRLVEEVPQPHVLSVAAGHLREALLSSAVKRRKLGRLVALDSDADSIAEVRLSSGRYGVEVVQATARQLVTGRLALGQFDLIYSTGLFDYVPQQAAQRLMWRLFQFLRPRGRLLVANFLPGIPDLGYMESYMDWKLIYRTRREMLEISLDVPQPALHDLRIFAEENQNIIFLQLTRR